MTIGTMARITSATGQCRRSDARTSLNSKNAPSIVPATPAEPSPPGTSRIVEVRNARAGGRPNGMGRKEVYEHP